ncbi:urease subunit gamma [Streptomyces sp. NPDC091272]|uniref:urease subunit gamma n=1 Tax=Streptomyces sp. NPDC091272 TaxID=3365981 RepID=UPI00380E4851
MHLTPHEQERLMIRLAADLVERRLIREPTLKLNYPEVMALFSAYVLEEARHDTKTVAELMDTSLSDVAEEIEQRHKDLNNPLSLPKTTTTPGMTTKPATQKTPGASTTAPPAPRPTISLMPGVREMIVDVQIEATFKDGTKLVTIPHPFGEDKAPVYPGQYELLKDDDDQDRAPYSPNRVSYNLDPSGNFPGGDKLWARNTADRPIQVGSHFHLEDVNPQLRFYTEVNGRASSTPAVVTGKRLHIAAGTSERFEPGVERAVWVVPIRGLGQVKGLKAGKTAPNWTAPTSSSGTAPTSSNGTV